MADLSKVRKSGLTFAVETPLAEHQAALNKLAPLERILPLLEEAKGKGWRRAKFYFMLGLPPTIETAEATEIVTFVRRIRSGAGMELRVNLGVFIPKPHTPFQWEHQLGVDAAQARIDAVRRGVGRGVRVGFQAPLLSLIEGLLSRGDERAGFLAEAAYRRGARLDAWAEYHKPETWGAAFAEAGWDVEAEVTRARSTDEALPWDRVRLGIASGFLRRERDRARGGAPTCGCSAVCAEPCGVCKPGSTVRDSGWSDAVAVELGAELPPAQGDTPPIRMLFVFCKEGKAVFLSHLNVVTVLARAFRRAGMRARLTQGFNPKPRIELACPLPLGVESEGEVGAIELYRPPEETDVLKRLNGTLPDGIRLMACARAPAPLPGAKPSGRTRALMAELWGADYLVREPPEWFLRAAGESSVPQLTVVRADAVGVALRHRQGNGGIVRALKTLCDLDPLAAGLRVRRTRILRADPDGEPVEMFASLCQRSDPVRPGSGCSPGDPRVGGP
jgi:radical SAM-linked protein